MSNNKKRNFVLLRFYFQRFISTELPAVYFDGKSYATFKSEQNSEQSIEIVALFKTKSEGVILATIFQNSSLLIEVYNGNVYCSGSSAGGNDNCLFDKKCR